MDKFTPFKQVNVGNFLFVPTRYEEYHGGKMISSGSTSIHISTETKEDGSVECTCQNNNIIGKVTDCHFDKCITLEDRVLMFTYAKETNARLIALNVVQLLFTPTREAKYYESNEPVFSSLFFQDGKLSKMTFTMANPERLVEFYI